MALDQLKPDLNAQSDLTNELAKTFGIDPATAARAIAAIEDALGFRIQRAMLSRGGVADLVSMLTSAHAEAGANPTAADVVTDGNDVLETLVGSKHQSRGIAARVARSSGIDVETATRLLPVVANSMITALQSQAEPQLAKLLKNNPSLAAASRASPLPLPGDPPLQSPGGTGSWGDTTDEPVPAPRSRKGGSPLPLPGDNIPGIERGPRQPVDNPFENLPDIIRRGGTRVPTNGGTSGTSLDSIIRQILSSILGVQSGGIIGNIIRLFLLRFLTSLARRFLGGLFGRR